MQQNPLTVKSNAHPPIWDPAWEKLKYTLGNLKKATWILLCASMASSVSLKLAVQWFCWFNQVNVHSQFLIKTQPRQFNLGMCLT